MVQTQCTSSPCYNTAIPTVPASAVIPSFAYVKLTCTHSLDFCPDHIVDLIHSHVVQGKADIKCPKRVNATECDGVLTTDSIAKWIEARDVNSYQALCLQSVKGSHPGRTNCPQCGYTIFHLGGEETPIVHCAYCTHVFCLKHRVEWQDGHNCDTYELFKEGDNMHSCPSCKILMTRPSGCNHMTCSSCTYQFCWICLKPWDRSTHTSYYVCPFPPAPRQ